MSGLASRPDALQQVFFHHTVIWNCFLKTWEMTVVIGGKNYKDTWSFKFSIKLKRKKWKILWSIKLEKYWVKNIDGIFLLQNSPEPLMCSSWITKREQLYTPESPYYLAFGHTPPLPISETVINLLGHHCFAEQSFCTLS